MCLCKQWSVDIGVCMCVSSSTKSPVDSYLCVCVCVCVCNGSSSGSAFVHTHAYPWFYVAGESDDAGHTHSCLSLILRGCAQTHFPECYHYTHTHTQVAVYWRFGWWWHTLIPMSMLDCLHRHIFLFHVYKSVSNLCVYICVCKFVYIYVYINLCIYIYLLM